MDLYNLYLAKNENTPIYLKSVKDQFISDSNKLLLSRVISKELYVTNNDERYKQLQQNIFNEITNWVATGNLDKLDETADLVSTEITLQLKYYNHLFIKHYVHKIMKFDQYQFELDNNVYRQEHNINGSKKTFKEFSNNDYENMNIGDYQNTFTFNSRYNKIPFYRTVLHNRNVDRSAKGNDFRFESKPNLTFKKYNNSDLLNNVSYLRKKK